MAELTKVQRQADRVYGTISAIRDDINDGEFDGARAHIDILKRQLADLDEKLYVEATSAAMEDFNYLGSRHHY